MLCMSAYPFRYRMPRTKNGFNKTISMSLSSGAYLVNKKTLICLSYRRYKTKSTGTTSCCMRAKPSLHIIRKEGVRFEEKTIIL